MTRRFGRRRGRVSNSVRVVRPSVHNTHALYRILQWQCIFIYRNQCVCICVCVEKIKNRRLYYTKGHHEISWENRSASLKPPGRTNWKSPDAALHSVQLLSLLYIIIILNITYFRKIIFDKYFKYIFHISLLC